jgi:hypothetical protein
MSRDKGNCRGPGMGVPPGSAICLLRQEDEEFKARLDCIASSCFKKTHLLGKKKEGSKKKLEN